MVSVTVYPRGPTFTPGEVKGLSPATIATLNQMYGPPTGSGGGLNYSGTGGYSIPDNKLTPVLTPPPSPLTPYFGGGGTAGGGGTPASGQPNPIETIIPIPQTPFTPVPSQIQIAQQQYTKSDAAAKFQQMLASGEIQGYSGTTLTPAMIAKKNLLESGGFIEKTPTYGEYFVGQTPEAKQFLKDVQPVPTTFEEKVEKAVGPAYTQVVAPEGFKTSIQGRIRQAVETIKEIPTIAGESAASYLKGALAVAQYKQQIEDPYLIISQTNLATDLDKANAEIIKKQSEERYTTLAGEGDKNVGYFISANLRYAPMFTPLGNFGGSVVGGALGSEFDYLWNRDINKETGIITSEPIDITAAGKAVVVGAVEGLIFGGLAKGGERLLFAGAGWTSRLIGKEFSGDLIPEGTRILASDLIGYGTKYTGKAVRTGLDIYFGQSIGKEFGTAAISAQKQQYGTALTEFAQGAGSLGGFIIGSSALSARGEDVSKLYKISDKRLSDIKEYGGLTNKELEEFQRTATERSQRYFELRLKALNNMDSKRTSLQEGAGEAGNTKEELATINKIEKTMTFLQQKLPIVPATPKLVIAEMVKARASQARVLGALEGLKITYSKLKKAGVDISSWDTTSSPFKQEKWTTINFGEDVIQKDVLRQQLNKISKKDLGTLQKELVDLGVVKTETEALKFMKERGVTKLPYNFGGERELKLFRGYTDNGKPLYENVNIGKLDKDLFPEGLGKKGKVFSISESIKLGKEVRGQGIQFQISKTTGIPVERRFFTYRGKQPGIGKFDIFESPRKSKSYLPVGEAGEVKLEKFPAFRKVGEQWVTSKIEAVNMFGDIKIRKYITRYAFVPTEAKSLSPKEFLEIKTGIKTIKIPKYFTWTINRELPRGTLGDAAMSKESSDSRLRLDIEQIERLGKEGWRLWDVLGHEKGHIYEWVGKPSSEIKRITRNEALDFLYKRYKGNIPEEYLEGNNAIREYFAELYHGKQVMGKIIIAERLPTRTQFERAFQLEPERTTDIIFPTGEVKVKVLREGGRGRLSIEKEFVQIAEGKPIGKGDITISKADEGVGSLIVTSGKKSSQAYLKSLYQEPQALQPKIEPKIEIPRTIPQPKEISKPILSLVGIAAPAVAVKSIYEGLGLYERTGNLEGLNYGQANNLLSRQDNALINLTKQQTKQSEATTQENAQLQWILQKQEQRQTQIQKQEQTQKQIQAPKFKFPQQAPPPETPGIRITYLEPRTEKGKIPLLYFDNRRRKPTKQVQSYSVLLRKKGRFVPVFTNLSREQALFRGSDITKKTLSRTFKIMPMGQTKEVFGFEEQFFPEEKVFRQYQIKKGRTIPLVNTFIQRSKFSLSSPEEKKMIQEAKRTRRLLNY